MMKDAARREATGDIASESHSNRAAAAGGSLLKLVAASVLTRSGEAYFDSLLRLLSVEFDAHHAFVGVVHPRDPITIETLLHFEDGRHADGFRYELHGTPCETVVSPNQVCVYSHDVVDLFPLDAALDQMGAEGYVGAPLVDREGEAIGIIVLITTSPLREPDAAQAMLQAFLRRSALELEHLLVLRRAQEEAARLEAHSLDPSATLSDFVLRLDGC